MADVASVHLCLHELKVVVLNTLPEGEPLLQSLVWELKKLVEARQAKDVNYVLFCLLVLALTRSCDETATY